MTEARINLVLRKDALDKLKDPRVPGQLRNYEIEYKLEQKYHETWIVAEWCPFNGTNCAYFEHASLSDLTEALANNVQHNSPNHVLTRIATQIEEKKREKGSKLKKLFAWMRMVKNGYLEGIDGDGI